jgi:hypothetical protein
MAVCCLWWCVPTVSQALTAKEILLLKQKGVSEQTIQMMLQSEMQAKKAASAQKMGVRTITRPDGGSAIVYSTGSDERDSRSREERLKEKRAWEMLQHIIIDTNQKGD